MKITFTLTRRHWILGGVVFIFQLLTSLLFLMRLQLEPFSLGIPGVPLLLALLMHLAVSAMVSAVVIIDLLEVFQKEPKRYIHWEHH